MVEPDELTQRIKSGEDPMHVARWLLDWAVRESDFEGSCHSCHTPGLESIVLCRSEEGMVRFYFAPEGEHKMRSLIGPNGHFTIGIHNHKYQITKICLAGMMANVTVGPTWPGDPLRILLHEYEFKSALRGEKMGVEFLGVKAFAPPREDVMSAGMHVTMQARELHTVLASEKRDTAWMVLEGRPKPIAPLIYSPRDGLELTSHGLYAPMSYEHARDRSAQVLELMA